MIKKLFILLFLVGIPFISFSAEGKVFDLSYPYNKNTIYWPTEKGFELQTLFYGLRPEGYFYSAFKFCTPEHGGTHIDAPRHFSKEGYSVDRIPLEQLIGNTVVIDVSNKTQKDSDYAITVEDIKLFEKAHRALSTEDIVLFYTGWGKYWDNKKKYLGSDKFGDVKNLHFPGLSKEAAQYLISRNIKGMGIDTASIDPGNSSDFIVHQTLLGANIYGLENVAHLDLIPEIGARLIVAPMKIEGGSGGPTRIYALF